MKLLLLGEHYSDNLGDAIISRCFRNFLLGRSIDFDCLDLSGRKKANKEKDIFSNKDEIHKRRNIRYLILKKYDFLHYHYSIIKTMKYVKQSIPKFVQYDAAIYIGGSVLINYFAFTIFYINNILNKKNIPVYFYGCGTGKLKKNTEKKMLIQALNLPNVKEIYLRDSIRFVNNNYMKNGKLAKKTYDIALTTQDIFENSKKRYEVGLGYISLDE